MRCLQPHIIVACLLAVNSCTAPPSSQVSDPWPAAKAVVLNEIERAATKRDEYSSTALMGEMSELAILQVAYAILAAGLESEAELADSTGRSDEAERMRTQVLHIAKISDATTAAISALLEHHQSVVEEHRILNRIDGMRDAITYASRFPLETEWEEFFAHSDTSGRTVEQYGRASAALDRLISDLPE